ncbi:site-specific integrase [Streptococcus oralis]|uniref:site-specific integrase n=1 Tax=Streptococcus oralis TaxID=1303 RepID=UPI001C1EFB62|nr:site-specific integrase [Streptococcus oralis]MBU6872848.1 site-specific integrase [Streptococcus oralis]
MASYRQRGKSKLWDYRIFDKKGKVVATNSGFKTKREAMNEAQEKERKLFQSNYTARFDSKATLYELWQDWYNLVILPSEKAKATKEGYYARGQSIERIFSAIPAMSLNHQEYQSRLNEFGENVTKDHLRRINADIRSAIKFSQRSGLQITDITEDVKIFGLEAGNVDDKYIHSILEYKDLLSHLQSKFNYRESVIPYLLYFLFKTGFRVGEGMAVCWSDIDFDNKTIKTYRRFVGDRQEFVPPKTKTSIREIPIDDDLLAVLEALRIEQEKVLFDREELKKYDLVFYDRRYKIPTNSGLNKSLRVCLLELGIGNQEMTATAGRHTYGSYLLAKGIDIWVVARLLGHKDIQQIIKTYGHVLQEVIDKEYELIRQFMLDKE